MADYQKNMESFTFIWINDILAMGVNKKPECANYYIKYFIFNH